jgi:hypothetical protein
MNKIDNKIETTKLHGAKYQDIFNSETLNLIISVIVILFLILLINSMVQTKSLNNDTITHDGFLSRAEFSEFLVYADDITRMNSTIVDGIFYVKDLDDIYAIIKNAKINNKQISVRGQFHTMGGHTIVQNGYVIDTKYLNNMYYNHNSQTVSAQCGATWGDLILYLNQFGMSPMIMQSYCTFSVGGTISVNAHGITSDYAMYESVVSITLINHNCKLVTITPNSELFSLVIGGYGLFGIIYEVTLKVVRNVKMTTDFNKLNIYEFKNYYEKILTDPHVEVKIARIDITNYDYINLYTFRKSATELNEKIISKLDKHPKEMSRISKLLYKWILPTHIIQKFRFGFEEIMQMPLDCNGEDRNLLVYESALPMAQLYEPIIKVDDTFILQEYFIPHDNFIKWMELIKFYLQIKSNQYTLLNITIRYVKHDTVTFLKYAYTNMFAFVFYFRIKRCYQADEELKWLHNILTQITLSLNGTFYLPYRHHYSDEQLNKAYPMINDFFNKKLKYDPRNVFSNLWYERYNSASANNI